MSFILRFLPRAVTQGIPLLYGCTGEILTEKSGNLNLGIPGIMYVGGISGIIGGFFYETYAAEMNPVLTILIPFVCSLLGSGLMALIYSFLTITLRANQNVAGLALTIFGEGVGNFFGGSLVKLVNNGSAEIKLNKTNVAFRQVLPFAKDWGWFGELFLNYGFLAYLAILVAVAVALVLKRTKTGLNLRAVGENPATADAAGINVTRYKYVATCVGGMIAGLGGLYYVMDYQMGTWANDGALGARGWLAIALVIFALWKPHVGIIGSVLFGGLYILYNYVGVARNIEPLFNMLPYVVTIVVLIITSIRKKRENQPPASLGLAYFREER
ncbi:MAG: ABC transporter permease [Clostridia bacterium]|nr:ABC transporter permease [Clostridia bacterium]